MQRSASVNLAEVYEIGANSTVEASEVVSTFLPITANARFVLKDDYDLQGQTLLFPERVCVISGRGVFKNGTLVGNNTKVQGDGPVFDNVIIKGNWSVPEISTKMFRDLSYANSLQNVLALSSSEEFNTITIEPGDYYVSTTSFGSALLVKSNTKIFLNGTVRLLPNDFKGCYVIGLKDVENVTIEGDGRVVGDRASHLGTSGEWGHGINIDSSSNVIIRGLTVTECWGDCIYVGNNSSDVLIENCTLSKGRRQGVSLTSGNRFSIINCDITDISGTAPQYAIDVEPNKDEIVDDVLIENVRIQRCYGGFTSWGGTSGAKIGSITIRKCSIEGVVADRPVRFTIGNKVIIEDCEFDTGNKPGIFTDVVESVVLKNNVIRSSNRNAVTIRRAKDEMRENNKIK